MSQIRTDEVSTIVQALAALPGSSAMNVTSKRFPRLGPAEPGTTYEEKTHSFRTDELPEALGLPHDVEEIIITLKGSLKAEAKDELVEKLSNFFDASSVGIGWDLRAKFTDQQSDHHYELTVFKELNGSYA